jgi:hypothetical protein
MESSDERSGAWIAGEIAGYAKLINGGVGVRSERQRFHELRYSRSEGRQAFGQLTSDEDACRASQF